MPDAPTRMLRFPDVRALVGLSRSTVRRLERSGRFPRRRQLSPGTVAWRQDEIDEWIAKHSERPKR